MRWNDAHWGKPLKRFVQALMQRPLRNDLEYLYGCGEKFPPHSKIHSFPRIPMQLNLKLAVISAAVVLAACGKKEEAAPAAAPAAARLHR